MPPQLLSQFSVDFSEFFQLLFPWPEEDHIIPRSCLTTFYQSYGPLSVLAILSTEVLVSATPPTVFKGFWWNFPDIVAMIWDVYILSGSCSTDFYQSYGRLTIFSSKSCLRNSSPCFQWILVKPSSYCSHDLKRIILYRGHAWPLLPELWPFAIYHNRKNLST